MMTTEQKNDIAQKLTTIEEISSRMWYESEYGEEDEIIPFDFDEASDKIMEEINCIRGMLEIPEPTDS